MARCLLWSRSTDHLYAGKLRWTYGMEDLLDFSAYQYDHIYASGLPSSDTAIRTVVRVHPALLPLNPPL